MAVNVNNYFGMDLTEAPKAVRSIKTFKSQLDTESKKINSGLKNAVNDAFAGSQTGAMAAYIVRINNALQELYKFLDGNEESFTVLFEKNKKSYQESDVIVQSGFNNME